MLTALRELEQRLSIRLSEMQSQSTNAHSETQRSLGRIEGRLEGHDHRINRNASDIAELKKTEKSLPIEWDDLKAPLTGLIVLGLDALAKYFGH